MLSGPAWSQTEIFVSGLYPGKGGGFLYPLPRSSVFQGRKKLKFSVLIKTTCPARSCFGRLRKCKPGGLFIFPAPSPLCPWLPSHASQGRLADNLAPLLQQVHTFRRIAPTISLCLPPEGLPPFGSAPLVSAQKENAAGNYHNGYHRRRSACRLIKGA